MREKIFRIAGVVGLTVIGILVCQLVIKPGIESEKRQETGRQLVLALYDYPSVEQLDEQMKIVRGLTTEGVFNQLTLDNEERTLNTYLKFEQKAVTVEILESTEDYVLYTLHTEALSEGRKFIFLYSLNEDGKVDWVQEAECIDFY